MHRDRATGGEHSDSGSSEDFGSQSRWQAAISSVAVKPELTIEGHSEGAAGAAADSDTPRSPSPSPSPICPGTGTGRPSPICPGAGTLPRPRPRFVRNRVLSPVPVPDLLKSGTRL